MPAANRKPAAVPPPEPTRQSVARSAPERRTLLIVEDDLGLQSQLRWYFEGYEVLVAEDRESAVNLVRRHEPPVVTLDLGLPPDPANATEGLEALDQILSAAPHTKVIVVTGNDDRENAVRAVGRGAYDFYQKPVDPEVLGLIVDRAYNLFELEDENRRLARKERPSPLAGIIAASGEMTRVCRMVEKVAPTSATVLLLGESGTGKELLARALHGLSPRAEQRFVAINCAAIPETLLESELFGYEKGAFTGAAKQTLGKIEYAHKGTLFLDEIGDLPMSLQAKLLRFLQERVIERVGGREEIPVDVRAFPRGPLLPAQRDQPAHPAPARAHRRLGAPGPALPRPLRSRARPLAAGLHRGRARRHRGLPLARQRAGARESGQARGHHGRKQPHRRGGPGARGPGRVDAPQPAAGARGGRAQGHRAGLGTLQRECFPSG